MINNFTCSHIESFGLKTIHDVMFISQSALTIDMSENGKSCNHSSFYKCPNTAKCISKHRLVDGSFDCFGGADESYNESCTLSDRRFRFRCDLEDKCRHGVALFDNVEQCSEGEDESDSLLPRENDKLSFQYLCNGYKHMEPDENNETDETHCEEWSCDNLYTRCDGAWTCFNGSDERYCGAPWCLPEEHPCISLMNYTTSCLSYDKVNDGTIDCLGASDERQHCTLHGAGIQSRYRCTHSDHCIPAARMCWSDWCCCENLRHKVCTYPTQLSIIYKLFDINLKTLIYAHFQLEHRTKQSIDESPAFIARQPVAKTGFKQNKEFRSFQVSFETVSLCSRGIYILDGTSSKCLCPPSYFGSRCEFQSQRVSLTVQFSFVCAPNCRTVFGLIVNLLDENGIIHSQEQFLYVPTRECGNKTNVYLLYRSRPKNATKKYHLRVDAYNKLDLTHYASWLLQIPFIFLPVNRIAARILIPSSSSLKSSLATSCSPSCGDHGQCIRTVNTNHTFCLCSSGWSGIKCNVPFQCRCSQNSLCVGFSTCVCPLDKRGPRCYLQSTCYKNPCKNGAVCIPNNQQLFEDNFTCVCPDGFSGFSCERTDSKIQISFSSDLSVPQLVLGEFITIHTTADPLKTTIVGKIPLDRDTIVLYQDLPFQLIFAKVDTDYYLVLFQLNYISALHYAVELMPEKRCPHIDELLDAQKSSYHFLKRVKYFHTVCQKKRDLMCFRDADASFMCICTQERHANCFAYDFNQTYDCQEINGCENSGQCYKGRDCPMFVACVCPECFYGTRCQFSTKGASLSLDVILGYQIRRNLFFLQQPAALKFSVAFTIVATVVGFFSSISSIITFQTPRPREVGCGFYLLIAAVTSLCIVVLFSYKLLFLIISQLSFVSNRTVLQIHCITLDFLLRSLPIIGDWLAAAIAMERALTVIQGVRFDKKQSRQLAACIITLIILLVFISLAQEPFHRHLADDEQEKRTWCVLQYSPRSTAYNLTVNLIHFLCPLMANFISAGIIIMFVARKRSTLLKKKSYNEHLYNQLQTHKHLLVGPLVLVLLATPRLIFVFISDCMKSARNPWLFLFGYYVSFIPALLHFPIFVLASKFYREEFKNVVRRIFIKYRFTQT